MNEIKLFSIERGTGEPLILLHGNGENSRYFARQIAYFSKTRRVIAVDTRGHGKSPRGKAPFTIRQFAEDLCCFMKEREIERANILGFSDGGNIAMVFALQYPEKVKRLILNGANLYPAGMKPLVVLPILAGYGAASLAAPYSAAARRKKELLGLMVRDPYIRPEDLKRISARTLVLVGKNDMIRHRHSLLIAKSIPGARFVCIEGDHFIAVKNPKQFNQVVERFLSNEKSNRR